MESVRWGTWEELILGGAVLRHGTAAWDAVAAEVRSRTLFPHLFTPEVIFSLFSFFNNEKLRFSFSFELLESLMCGSRMTIFEMTTLSLPGTWLSFLRSPKVDGFPLAGSLRDRSVSLRGSPGR